MLDPNFPSNKKVITACVENIPKTQYGKEVVREKCQTQACGNFDLNLIQIPKDNVPKHIDQLGTYKCFLEIENKENKEETRLCQFTPK